MVRNYKSLGSRTPEIHYNLIFKYKSIRQTETPVGQLYYITQLGKKEVPG